jgi:hypothetical protein
MQTAGTKFEFTGKYINTETLIINVIEIWCHVSEIKHADGQTATPSLFTRLCGLFKSLRSTKKSDLVDSLTYFTSLSVS